VHAVVARGVIGLRVGFHSFAHAALQQRAVDAASSPQHAPQGAGALQRPLALFGYHAFPGAQKRVRPTTTGTLACGDHRPGTNQSQPKAPVMPSRVSSDSEPVGPKS
jgi:hypothetical protein